MCAAAHNKWNNQRRVLRRHTESAVHPVQLSGDWLLARLSGTKVEYACQVTQFYIYPIMDRAAVRY
jgi:hypothetical protein